VSKELVKYNHGFSEKWVLQLSPLDWRGNVDVEFLDVPISKLESAGCCIDPDVVNGWVRTLEDGCPIPPPVAVLTERGTYYLHDGNHRFEALNQFLADDEQALVRVAVAVPLPGHEFVYRWFGDYGTYVLRDAPRLFAASAQATIALLASALALFMAAVLQAFDHTPIYALLILSVVISAWVGGWRAGLIATLSNLIGAAYFLLPPTRSLDIARTEELVHFTVTGLVMALIVILMQIVRWHPRVEVGFRQSVRCSKPLANSERTTI
jgi:hypothetical protein